LGSLLGNIRHDLHNPLNDILGFSELLQEEARAQEQTGLISECEAVHQAAGRLLKQINHSLDIEHLKVNQGALDQLGHTADALLSQILARTESLSAKCTLLSNRTFGDDVARIDASTRSLMELMPDVLALIKPADLTAVAQPESDAERDTESIIAPLAQTQPTAGPTQVPPVGDSAGSLLVVEDSEANRTLLTRRLQRQGYDVWAVENGRQALALLRTRQFELALIDLVMPDLDGFTALTLATSPNQVVRLLNEVFSAFDLLADKHSLEKVKTSGDSYMAVSGLPTPRSDHAETAAAFALDLQDELARCNRAFGTSMRMRVGINSGPVIAGVIGRNKFIYDLWGDTVNTASRMESHAQPGMIQVSPSTHARLQGKFELRERGPIQVKGKGIMTTYFLVGRSAPGP
jgi:class 3 adenylate cyclase